MPGGPWAAPNRHALTPARRPGCDGDSGEAPAIMQAKPLFLLALALGVGCALATDSE